MLPPLPSVPDRYDPIMAIVTRRCVPSMTPSLCRELIANIHFYPSLDDVVMVDGEQLTTAELAMHELLLHLCCDSVRALAGATVDTSTFYPIAAQLGDASMRSARRPLPSKSAIMRHVELTLLRTHPTLAHDAQLVAEPETGVVERVRRVARQLKATGGAAGHSASRVAQLVRVYARAPLVRDTQLARKQVADDVTDALWTELLNEALASVVNEVTH